MQLEKLRKLILNGESESLEFKKSLPHISKPWNPIIAEVFYRAGVIEQWGTGTLNIIKWCKENHNPPPVWEEQPGAVMITFLPSTFFLEEAKEVEQALVANEEQTTGQVTGQVTELNKVIDLYCEAFQ